MKPILTIILALALIVPIGYCLGFVVSVALAPFGVIVSPWVVSVALAPFGVIVSPWVGWAILFVLSLVLQAVGVGFRTARP